EEPRRHEVGLGALLPAVELDRRRDGIGRAAPKLSLVIDRGALRPKVDACRECRQVHDGSGVQVIAIIGKIGDPSIALNLVAHGSSKVLLDKRGAASTLSPSEGCGSPTLTSSRLSPLANECSEAAHARGRHYAHRRPLLSRTGR